MGIDGFRVHIKFQAIINDQDILKAHGIYRTSWKAIEFIGPGGGSIFVKITSNNLLQIEGNPTAFFKGHNFFGSYNLAALVESVILQLCLILEIRPTEEEYNSLVNGDYILRKIDIARDFKFCNKNSIGILINGIALTMIGNEKITSFHRESLVHNSLSTLYQNTLYNKGLEFSRNKALIKSDALNSTYGAGTYEKLLDFSQGILRFETRLHRKYLQQHGLQKGSDWTVKGCRQLSIEMLAKLRLPTRFPKPVNSALFEKFKRKVDYMQIYELWRRGANLKEIYSDPATYRRVLARLAEIGIDGKANPIEDFENKTCRTIIEELADKRVTHAPPELEEFQLNILEIRKNLRRMTGVRGKA